MFYEGSTFRVKSEPIPHVWVIITNPELFPDQVIQVNMTTYDEGGRPNDPRNDPACILTRGHSSITHATCMYYGGAQVAALTHLEYRLSSGKIVMSDPVTPEALEMIRLRATRSDHMLPIIYDILVEQGLV